MSVNEGKSEGRERLDLDARLFEVACTPSWLIQGDSMRVVAANRIARDEFDVHEGGFFDLIECGESELRELVARWDSSPGSRSILRLRRQNAALATMEIAGQAFDDPSYGRVVLIQAWDAAERVLLEEQSKGLGSLAENAPDIIARFDTSYRHLYVNPAVEKATGRPRQEFIGKTNRELGMPEEACRYWESRYKAVLQGDGEQLLEFVFPTPDGPRHFQSRLVPETCEDGSIRSLLGITRDVTALREVEAARRRSENRIRQLIEQAPISIQSFAPDGRSLGANPAWSDLWKVPLHQLGQYNILNDPQLQEGEIGAAIRQAFAGTPLYASSVYYDPVRTVGEGRPRWVEACIYPVLEGEAVAEVVVLLQDVTERVRAEQEVRRLTQELEARVEQRTAELQSAYGEVESFAYSVSHDLRTPLRAIAATSMILLEDFEEQLGDEGGRLLRRQSEAARKLGQLIDDLLQYSRLGRKDLERLEVDLSEIARSVAEELARSHPDRTVNLQIDQVPKVMGDPQLLQLALENLLGNAFKFTQSNAAANIRFGASPNPNDGRMEYFVEDDGVGFDQEYVHKLFRPFERLHGEREYPGTGIGLANVRRIVERHGGDVGAESGSGSTRFTFSLG
jgi:PAS domain S-box-containing protein